MVLQISVSRGVEVTTWISDPTVQQFADKSEGGPEKGRLFFDMTAVLHGWDNLGG